MYSSCVKVSRYTARGSATRLGLGDRDRAELVLRRPVVRHAAPVVEGGDRAGIRQPVHVVVVAAGVVTRAAKLVAIVRWFVPYMIAT